MWNRSFRNLGAERALWRRWLLLSVAFGLALRAAPPDLVPRLSQGSLAELTIDALHPGSLVLEVSPNEEACLLLDQDEPSLEIRIVSENGAEIRAASAGYAGLFVVLVPRSGLATVQLIATAPGAVREPATVFVSLEQSALTRSQAAAQLRAERTFLQAQRLRREPNAGSLGKSIALLEQAREWWRRGHSRAGEAVALAAAGDSWFQMSSYGNARRDYERGRQIAAPDSRLEAYLLNAQGAVDLELWRREGALQLASRALAISRKLHDGRGEADALANSAIARWLLGRSDARDALKEALDTGRARGNRVATARILSVQGWLERDLGHRAGAIELMDAAARLFHATGRRVDALGEMLDVASTEGSRGDAYAAILRHVGLLRLFHNAGSVFNEANADNNIGLDYLGLNRARDALPYFREARRLFTATGNVWAAQTSLGLMCETQISLQLYRAAQPDCEESKRIAVQFQTTPYMALADARLGKLAEVRGQVALAAMYYRRAARLNSEAGYSRGEAAATMSLGLLEYKRRRPDAAMELFERALSLSEAEEDPAGIIDAKHQIARLLADAGRLAEAQRQLEQATRLSEAGRQRIRIPKYRMSYFAAVRKCYGLYVEVLMRRHAADPRGGFDRQALEESDASRARTLFDALLVDVSSPGRRMPETAGLSRIRSALNKRYEDRVNLIVTGQRQPDVEANADEIRRLSAEYDQALALAATDAQPAANEFAPLDSGDLARASSESVILEYHLGEDRSYLWRIEHGQIASFTLPRRKAITDAVERWRELVLARQRRPAESFAARLARIEAADRRLPMEAGKLSCMLLAGLRFPRGARLTVIADGNLQSLPFAALPSDGCRAPAGPPLAAAHEIANTPSLRILISGSTRVRRETPQKRVAIFADPVFSARDSRLSRPGERAGAETQPTLRAALRDAGFGAELPRLWATRKEAEKIAALAGPGSALLALDFDASLQTALSPRLLDYPIWHFATHGLLDPASPDLSGLVFSLVNSAGRPVPGFLKAQDIFDLSIGPDLVVLSACNSGLGEQVEGEGAVGLSHAFLHAGARQVISTLWSVEDAVSGDLMAEFYRGLFRDHLSPVGALRSAQRAILRRTRAAQPYYWAGYILMSN